VKKTLKEQTLVTCLKRLNKIIDKAGLSSESEKEAKAHLKQIARLFQDIRRLGKGIGSGCNGGLSIDT
jgi:hypothetical protein